MALSIASFYCLNSRPLGDYTVRNTVRNMNFPSSHENLNWKTENLDASEKNRFSSLHMFEVLYAHKSRPSAFCSVASHKKQTLEYHQIGIHSRAKEYLQE